MSFFLVGCVSPSIIDSRSTDKFAVVIVDPMYPSSDREIDAPANAHCQKYNSKAVFIKKEQGLMLIKPAYSLYYYECQTDNLSKPILNVDSMKNNSPLDLSSSRQKCSELGFKAGTEGFGKCVLQLTK